MQDDLRPALRRCHTPFWYLCGERDAKFRAIAEELSLPCRIIRDAGTTRTGKSRWRGRAWRRFCLIIGHVGDLS